MHTDTWVEKQRSDTLHKKTNNNNINKKKRKKIQKSCDFRDISKSSGTNIRRQDTYPEKKNHQDFRTVIFGAKKIFKEN